jgi:hypothetical protein
MHALTKECFMNTRFDPVKDRLEDTRPAPSPVCTVMSEPWKNPDARVQAAHEAYLAALAAARGPEPERRLRVEKAEPVKPNPFRRPGFA